MVSDHIGNNGLYQCTASVESIVKKTRFALAYMAVCPQINTVFSSLAIGCYGNGAFYICFLQQHSKGRQGGC